MTYTEMIVTGLVIGLVLYAMWRVGQLNPVGTGRLARRMDQLEKRVGEAETARQASFVEVDARMDGIEKSVLALAEAGGATKIAVEAMRIELAGDRGLTERTWSAVDRLQNYFIEQSFKRGDQP